MKIRVTVWPDDLDYENRLQYDHVVGDFEFPRIPVETEVDGSNIHEVIRLRYLRETAINCLKADIAYGIANALDKIDHTPYGKRIRPTPVSRPRGP